MFDFLSVGFYECIRFEYILFKTIPFRNAFILKKCKIIVKTLIPILTLIKGT